MALVNAAPTDNQDSAAVAQAPGSDASGAGDIGSILNGLSRREADVEPRQLAGLMDTVANLAPVVDTVLGLLGLARKDAMGAASALPQDQFNQIQSLVQQATGGLPVPLPIPGGAAGGAQNGTAGNSTAGNSANGTTTGDAGNNGTTANTHTQERREPPEWVDERRAGKPGNGGSGSNGGAQGFALPLQMDVIPGGAPFGAVPKPPVGVAPGTPAPGGAAPGGDSNNSSAPTGAQSPSPFSPGLPPNPPNTPAEAMSSPPLFNPSSVDGDATFPNATYPANSTETSTTSGEPYYPTESA